MEYNRSTAPITIDITIQMPIAPAFSVGAIRVWYSIANSAVECDGIGPEWSLVVTIASVVEMGRILRLRRRLRTESRAWALLDAAIRTYTKR